MHRSEDEDADRQGDEAGRGGGREEEGGGNPDHHRAGDELGHEGLCEGGPDHLGHETGVALLGEVVAGVVLHGLTIPFRG